MKYIYSYFIYTHTHNQTARERTHHIGRVHIRTFWSFSSFLFVKLLFILNFWHKFERCCVCVYTQKSITKYTLSAIYLFICCITYAARFSTSTRARARIREDTTCEWLMLCCVCVCLCVCCVYYVRIRNEKQKKIEWVRI